jgi:hypothetical protein
MNKGYDVRKSKTASETYRYLLSPLSVRARASNATTNSEEYTIIQT